MAETRRKFDAEFRAGAVRMRETRKPIAQVARDLGINEGTLGNWVNQDRQARSPGNARLSESEREDPLRLRRENAELAVERDRVMTPLCCQVAGVGVGPGCSAAAMIGKTSRAT